VVRFLSILLLFVSASSGADQFWDEDCLRKELAPCGTEVIPKEGELTEAQKKILTCRILALVKCRKPETAYAISK
jgi:hypothetical protein